MSAHAQTWIALAIVLVTVGAFVWRALARRGRHGCGESCGCPSQKLARSQPANAEAARPRLP